MKRNPEFSIVIPFYNEKKNIPLVLNAYQKIKNSSVYSFELLCINNGSTDGSEDLFAKLLKNKKYPFARLVTVKKNKGYGFGIMSGVSRAKGDVIAWTHADMQTDAKDPFRAYEEYMLYHWLSINSNERFRSSIASINKSLACSRHWDYNLHSKIIT